ncbi:MAG: AAA family ATPase [Acidobacteriota bacterium]|nr:AAA family ATPase [Acidobacteriota bacterium]
MAESLVVRRVKEQIEKARLSQTRAAAEIGISGSALSQWIAGKYKGDATALTAKAQRWLDSTAKRSELVTRMPDPPEWVETPTAKRILGGLGYAQMAADLAIVYGGAGLGKSISATHYAGSSPNVWVAVMTAGGRSMAGCLERVAMACGVRSVNVRPWRLESEIVDRTSGTHGLLVVDEAQHLDTRALEALRGLHDQAGIGLALMGNELLYSRLTGGRRAAEFAQLFSRVGKRVRLTRPAQADVDAILRAWSISGAAERAQALEIARQPGGLRGLTKALRLAAMMAAGQAVAETHLKSAWRELAA